MPCSVLHWYHWETYQEYGRIQCAMLEYAQSIMKGEACEAIWLMTHCPVYTFGANVSSDDVARIEVQDIPIYRSSRGGLLTFHGPEQRMIYPFIHIKHRGLTVSSYLDMLEQWVIRILKHLDIIGQQVQERRGVWVGKNKIAALGIQIKQGVAFHGVAFNIYTPSEHFTRIAPCGLAPCFGITSLEDKGAMLTLDEVDQLILKECPFQ